MKTTCIIEGLNIFAKYYTKPDGYNVGAEHDVIYAYATDNVISEEDLNRLVELGWHQEVDTGDDDFEAKHYDPEEGWSAYV